MSITSIFAKSLSNYDNQKSVGSKLRAKRIVPLLEMMEAVFNENGSVSIIDIGGTEKYWGIIPKQYIDEYNVNITIVNLPGTAMSEDHEPFKFIEADGCDLSEFPDESFHIAHSNSVVEHVGDWVRMVQFTKEISRISKKYFVQTPNYWFPVEPHCMTPFFHWLPKPTRLWLVSHFQLGHWSKATSIDEAVRIVEGARLLNKKMFQGLFLDANLLTENLFFMPKSFIAIRK
ncbi:MAG: methyltransferase domain-containing protein [Methylobacter sp.]|jgi:hypothetical protein|nr:methyltransferase domain-containing protein [Methylobacter sp.]